MANAHMPDEFFDLLKHHLPPEKAVGPEGGRPTKGHRVVMRVIWFVLVTGCRWEDVPLEIGCSGRTAHRRLEAWEKADIWGRLHADMLRLLKEAGKLEEDTAIVDSVTVRAFGGGDNTGKNPTDRARKGVKHTVMVDGDGAVLAIRSAGANESDHTQIIPTVMDFPQIGRKDGEPEQMPEVLYADRGYDSEATRAILRWLGIEPKIAKRGTPHGSGLGKVRWVVERTISWLKGLRRMRVRYDRLGVIQDAWASLAAAVICFRILTRDVI